MVMCERVVRLVGVLSREEPLEGNEEWPKAVVVLEGDRQADEHQEANERTSLLP